MNKSTLLFAPAGLLALSSGLVQVHGAQVDYFLKLDGITGESTDRQHKGWIDVSSFQWGVGTQATVGSATGGAGAGKVKFTDLNVSKVTDKATPDLFRRCVSGEHFLKSPILEVVSHELKLDNKNTGETVLLRLTLVDAQISSVNEAGLKLEQPQEALSLNFTRVEVSNGGVPGSTGSTDGNPTINSSGLLDTVTDGN